MNIDRSTVEDLLFLEARLLDAKQYDDWLQLWSDPATYWVPAGGNGTDDPEREVSIVYANRRALEDRVRRLSFPSVHSQDPPSELQRVVSNVSVSTGMDDAVEATAMFILVEVRRGCQEIYSGRTEYTLVPAGDGLRIREKKVVLGRRNTPLNNLTFLL